VASFELHESIRTRVRFCPEEIGAPMGRLVGTVPTYARGLVGTRLPGVILGPKSLGADLLRVALPRASSVCNKPATEPDLVPVRIAVGHFPHTVRMLPSQHKPTLEPAAGRPLGPLWAQVWAHGCGLRLIRFAGSITACTRTSR
jgi:hypothetical protein